MDKAAQHDDRAEAGPVLLRADDGGVATLTLNRPAARNALSTRLMSALQDEVDRIAADRRVRVVVVAANGPAFCAGHDLREIRAAPGRAAYEALFAQCSALMLSLMRLPQPVVARVQGTATAAGCQLVATCDLAVAADTAKFATPGVDIGLFCSTPMVAVGRNVARKRTMEMLLTGAPIDAAAAERYGLVNRVVPARELEAATLALARSLAARSALFTTMAVGSHPGWRRSRKADDSLFRSFRMDHG